MPTNNTKQAAWVAIGSFMSFLVGIVSPMILSRFFTKGDYGTYKQVMFVYGSLLAVFSLGLPKAYAFFLPKYSKEYSRDVINKITRIFLVLGSVFSLTLFFGAGIISSLLKNPNLEFALKIFAPTPLLLLPTLGMDGIYSAFRRTKFLALYTTVTRILTITCTVLPVIVFNGTYIHALIGFDVASVITCLIALYMKSWPVRKIPSKQSDLKLNQILSFSLPLMYASLWGMVIASANQFFISRYYGNEVFAEFSNGYMELPIVGMIIGAIGSVLLPVFSGMDSGEGMNEKSLAIWNSALIKSAKIIFPMLIYSIFFSRILMTCMYSNLYENSTIYFQLKNIGGLLYIIPFAPIILAIGKTRAYASIHMVVAIVMVVADVFVVRFVQSAFYIAIVSEICQVLKIFLLLRIISKYSGKTIRGLLPLGSLFKLLLLAICCGLVSSIIVSFFALNKFVLLVISLLLFCTFYYGGCWLFSISYRDVVGGFINTRGRCGFVIKLLP